MGSLPTGIAVDIILWHGAKGAAIEKNRRKAINETADIRERGLKKTMVRFKNNRERKKGLPTCSVWGLITMDEKKGIGQPFQGLERKNRAEK